MNGKTEKQELWYDIIELSRGYLGVILMTWLMYKGYII